MSLWFQLPESVSSPSLRISFSSTDKVHSCRIIFSLHSVEFCFQRSASTSCRNSGFKHWQAHSAGFCFQATTSAAFCRILCLSIGNKCILQNFCFQVLVTSAFCRILFSSIGNKICSAEFCFQALASEFRNYKLLAATQRRRRRRGAKELKAR